MEPNTTCDTIPEFTQDKNLVLIEYPGKVKNVERMIKSLGGTRNISGTYHEDNKRLDLRFRPEDPCCHPVCGDRTSINAVLLKVKKYRRKKKTGEASDSKDEFRYRPEIIGVIGTAYKFNGLCDFQYLPLYNDVKNDELVNMVPNLQVTNLEDSTYTKEVPLFLPPATFSRFDQQQDVLFRSNPKYKGQGDPNPDHISVTRPRRAHFAQYLKYEEEWTPKEPLPDAVEAYKRSAKQDNSFFESVSKLFQQRPIWSKNAISCILQCRHDRLKTVLPTIAYYFVTGPWRSLWVRFDYDPRKDPGAAKYQLLDFRIRQGLNTPHIPIKAKRSTLQYRLPNLLPRSKSVPTTIVNNLDEKNENKTEKRKPRIFCENVYLYRSGELPAYRQTFYQVCDVLHPSVEEILKEKTSSKEQCDSKSGWLPDGVSARMRDILSKDIQKTITKRYKGIQIRNMQRDVYHKVARRKIESDDENPNEEDVQLEEDLNQNFDDTNDEDVQLDENLNDEDFDNIQDEEAQLPPFDEEEEFEDYDDTEVDGDLEDEFSNLDTGDPLDSTEPFYDNETEDLDDFLDAFGAHSPGSALDEDIEEEDELV